MLKRGKLDQKPDDFDKSLKTLTSKMQISDRRERPQAPDVIKELLRLKEKHDIKLYLSRKMNPNLSKKGLE